MIIDDKDGGKIIYDNVYAGAYIDEDKLVVCITDEEQLDKQKEDNVEYRLVSNSFNDLLDIQDELGNLYVKIYNQYKEASEEYELLSCIAGFGIDDKLNKVIVDIVDLSEYKIQLFEKIFGQSDLIEYNDVAAISADNETYRPGRAIYVITNRTSTSISYSRASIGYRAYLKTSDNKKFLGFVTCGHGVRDSIDGNVYSSTLFDTIIGTIETHQYGGTVDATFVKKVSGVAIGTVVAYGENGSISNRDNLASNTYMTSLATGTTVYKVGSTTYKTKAKVTSTNYTTTIDGVKFTNLTKTEKFCESGDSGGIVYTYYNSLYIPAGIIKGSGSKSFLFWSESYSFFVKASEIAKKMNVYAY